MDPNNQLVQDETIKTVLNNEANKFMAAAAIIRGLYMGLTEGGAVEDRKVGETRTRYQRISDMMKLVGGLEMRGSAHKRPSAPGIYQSSVDAYNTNSSLNRPELEKSMMKNPRAARSVTTT